MMRRSPGRPSATAGEWVAEQQRRIRRETDGMRAATGIVVAALARISLR